MFLNFNGQPTYGARPLLVSVVSSACYFFIYTGPRGHRHPTIYEAFQSGTASDVQILISLGMIIAIAYSVAVLISDVRSTGRWW